MFRIRKKSNTDGYKPWKDYNPYQKKPLVFSKIINSKVLSIGERNPVYAKRIVRFELNRLQMIPVKDEKYDTNLKTLKLMLQALNDRETLMSKQSGIPVKPDIPLTKTEEQEISQIVRSPVLQRILNIYVGNKSLTNEDATRIQSVNRYIEARITGQADKTRTALTELGVHDQNQLDTMDVKFRSSLGNKEGIIIPNTTLLKPLRLEPLSPEFVKKEVKSKPVDINELKKRLEEANKARLDIHHEKISGDADELKKETIATLDSRIIGIRKQLHALETDNTTTVLDSEKDVRLGETRDMIKKLMKERNRVTSLPTKVFTDKNKRQLLEKNAEVIGRIEDRISNVRKIAKTTPQSSETIRDFRRRIEESKDISKTPLSIIAQRAKDRIEGKEVSGKLPSLLPNTEPINVKSTAQTVFAFKPCTNCLGTGAVSNNRTCKTCGGSGSSRFSDYGNLNVRPKWWKKEGLTTREIIHQRAGEKYVTAVEKASPFGKLENLRLGQGVVRTKTTEVVSKRDPDLVLKTVLSSDGKSRTWWVDPKTNRPRKGTNPYTGYPHVRM